MMSLQTPQTMLQTAIWPTNVLQICPNPPKPPVQQSTEKVRILVRIYTALYGQNTAFVRVGSGVRTGYVLCPYLVCIPQISIKNNKTAYNSIG